MTWVKFCIGLSSLSISTKDRFKIKIVLLFARYLFSHLTIVCYPSSRWQVIIWSVPEYPGNITQLPLAPLACTRPVTRLSRGRALASLFIISGNLESFISKCDNCNNRTKNWVISRVILPPTWSRNIFCKINWVLWNAESEWNVD